MASKQEVSIFWFRRDLRLSDNVGLFHALKNNKTVLPVFIFDTDILNRLENKEDKRVEFIHLALQELQKQLLELGSSLCVLHGTVQSVFEELFETYSVKNIYTNNDYEPSAIERDNKLEELAKKQNIPFYSFKDQVVFEKSEITKDDGLSYTIFTPYMKKWKNTLNDSHIKPFATKTHFSNFIRTKPFHFPALKELGFKSSGMKFSAPSLNEKIVSNYHESRNFPAVEGTSRLSVHLRFGTISIRHLVSKAKSLNDQWLNELIWREFYMMILYHFPHVVNGAFKKRYDRIPWRNNEAEFEAWCKGETGYPIVDAGMRELNATGFMHNRVRMIVASFLVKHLLIDWSWGEAYFAAKLMDFDLSANNGGWQWAASSGCDAAPYFRVFSPEAQTIRFDPKMQYIRKWVPEFEELTYPKPIVDHKFARERVLNTYKKALGNNLD